jgi:hypothetical protein
MDRSIRQEPDIFQYGRQRPHGNESDRQHPADKTQAIKPIQNPPLLTAPVLYPLMRPRLLQSLPRIPVLWLRASVLFIPQAVYRVGAAGSEQLIGHR